MPPMDVVERETSITVHMDVPGMKREDLNIELTQGRLCVQGTRIAEYEKDDAMTTRLALMLERGVGKFERCLQLPVRSAQGEDGIDASLDSGVLKITVQKSEAAKQSKGSSISIR